MKPEELPLLEIFNSLRQRHRLPLGVDEYLVVVRSRQAGFGVASRQELEQLCCTLWAKSNEESRLIQRLFEQMWKQVGDRSPDFASSPSPPPTPEEAEANLPETPPSELPEHEKAKEIIGDMVKILLSERGINYDALGSTTLKNERMTQAVEPDACFYIQNQAAVIGKNRLDMSVDPPPDLGIQIDLTSRTQLENYQILGVPELRRYARRGLQINVLQAGRYVESDVSFTFPDIPYLLCTSLS